MLIDVRTAYLLLGVLYIILPLTVYLLLRNHRQTTVRFWCFGGLAVGLGMVILGLRPLLDGHAPDFITYTMGNTLIVLGYTMRVQSLQIDLQKALSKTLLIGWVLLFIVLYEYARSAFGSLQLRIEFAFFWTGISIVFLAKAAFQYERLFGVKQARFIWMSYSLLALVLLYKVLSLIVGWDKPILFEGSLINSLTLLLAILTAIYSNVAYIGMILARTEMERSIINEKNQDLVKVLNKQNQTIKDLMRVQAFSVLGSYGSTVVHEVLQPLTAMRFALENLKIYLSKQSADEAASARIQAVDASAVRAIGVIENLRNFMIEHEVQVESVLLSEVLAEVLEMIKNHAQKRDVEILLKRDVKDIFVMADEHQLQRVLFNLLHNAIGAIDKTSDMNAPRKVIVDIKYVQRNNFVLIKVIDSGAGLNPQSPAKIFDWLATDSGEGMDIGLALSKMLVESWHGQISAYDADPKVDGLSGAVFEVKLKNSVA